MVGVTWDGRAKPRSRHLRTLEAKVTGRKPEGGAPQSPGARLGAARRMMFPCEPPHPCLGEFPARRGPRALEAGPYLMELSDETS